GADAARDDRLRLFELSLRDRRRHVGRAQSGRVRRVRGAARASRIRRRRTGRAVLLFRRARRLPLPIDRGEELGGLGALGTARRTGGARRAAALSGTSAVQTLPALAECPRRAWRVCVRTPASGGEIRAGAA